MQYALCQDNQIPMNQQFHDFEAMLNDLTPKVREKAIQLALEMLAEGTYSDKEQALRAGIQQAEEWFMDLEG
jgi:uncharacterized protein YdaT